MITPSRPFRVGDRVEWTNLASRLGRAGLPRPFSYREQGTVYRIDPARVAVLPDAWKAEGVKDGLLKEPEALTLLSS